MGPARMAILQDGDFDEAQTAIARNYIFNGSVINVVRLFARFMDFFTVYKPLGRYAQNKSALPARIRELAILRLLVLNRGHYEWGHHVRSGREAGLTSEEVERIKAGPDAGWSEADALVLRSVDSLRYQADLSDELYDGLRALMGEREIFDLMVTVCNYNLVSTIINVARIPNDPGVQGLDDTAHA